MSKDKLTKEQEEAVFKAIQDAIAEPFTSGGITVPSDFEKNTSHIAKVILHNVKVSLTGKGKVKTAIKKTK